MDTYSTLTQCDVSPSKRTTFPSTFSFRRMQKSRRRRALISREWRTLDPTQICLASCVGLPGVKVRLMSQLAGQSRESMLDGYMSLREEVGSLFVTIVRPMPCLFRKPRDSKLEKDIPPRGEARGWPSMCSCTQQRSSLTDASPSRKSERISP